MKPSNSFSGSHPRQVQSLFKQVASRFHLTLASKLAFSLLLLTGLISTLVIWQTEQDTYQLLLDLGRAEARVYLRGIEQEIQWHAPDLDQRKLREVVIRSVTYEPEDFDFRIEHLFVLDPRGKVIASNQPEHIGEDLSGHAYIVRAFQEDRPVSSDEIIPYASQEDPSVMRPAIDVAVPLHLETSILPVGTIEAELDVSDSAQILKKRYWDIRRELLTKLALLMGSFGILSFVVLRRQVINRMGEMAQTARSIAQGDLGSRVREMGGDEIGALANSFNQMTDSLERTIANLKRTELLAMTKLAELAEKRDSDTGAHLQRIPRYCQLLAEELRRDSPYTPLLDDKYIQALIDASLLHDIGKVGVPDRILLKPDHLTSEEFTVMRQHPLIGGDVLSGADFLLMARDMALCHHERYDGSGYPNGLSGGHIPLPARIVALADMYDALTSKRVYKEAYSHEQAYAMIKEPISHEQASAIIAKESGRRFDPYIMRAFMRCEAEFRKIREQIAD